MVYRSNAKITEKPPRKDLQPSSRLFYLDAKVKKQTTNILGLSFQELTALVEKISEPAFRALEKQVLPAALKPGAVVALGGGAVMDDDNWALITDRATTVYIDVPFETVWLRIQKLPGRPLIAGRTEQDVEALYERRRNRYEQAEHRVNGERAPGEVAADVLKLWSG